MRPGRARSAPLLRANRESPLRRQAWALASRIITPREEYCQVPEDKRQPVSRWLMDSEDRPGIAAESQRSYDWPLRTSGNTDQGGTMTGKADKPVWFITGAGRGMGVDFVKAALAAGHAVVATGRDTGAGAKAVGKAGDLLVLKLDVTNRADATAAARAAVDRFGRDRKSTRLNSSHGYISYAVFCLKKKKKT